MQEMTIRRRANISSSTKGVITFDCTVEITNKLDDDAGVEERLLSESDSLVSKLKQRYPLAEV